MFAFKIEDDQIHVYKNGMYYASHPKKHYCLDYLKNFYGGLENAKEKD